MKALIALLASGIASAANFGPSPYFVSDDPSVTVDDVNAFVQTHVLAISVNGVYYKTLAAPYVYTNTNGTHAVYKASNVTLHAADGTYVTASVVVEYWTTRLANGRITSHNFVDGGSVQ